MSFDAGSVARTQYKNMAELTKDLENKEVKGNPLKKLLAIVFGSGVALKVSGKTYVVDRKHFASVGIKDAKGMRDFVVSQVKGFRDAAQGLSIKETSKQEYAMELLKGLNELEGESRSITAFFDALRGTGSLDDNAINRLKDQAVEVPGKKDVWKLNADTIKEIRTLCGVKAGAPAGAAAAEASAASAAAEPAPLDFASVGTIGDLDTTGNKIDNEVKSTYESLKTGMLSSATLNEKTVFEVLGLVVMDARKKASGGGGAYDKALENMKKLPPEQKEQFLQAAQNQDLAKALTRPIVAAEHQPKPPQNQGEWDRTTASINVSLGDIAKALKA